MRWRNRPRTERKTSAPDQMVVVVLTKAIEDGDVPEVRAGIAAENPAAAASANEQAALQPTPQ